MLCLSDVLGGFLVCGSLYGKTMAKSRQKTATEDFFPSKLWGGCFAEWLYADKIKTDKWGIFLYPFARVCPPNMAGVYKSRFVNSYARVLSLPILFSSITSYAFKSLIAIFTFLSINSFISYS